MTTLIFIENVLGSGQVVKITEDFGGYSVCRDLNPGDHARLVVSPFKSISVEEVPLSAAQRSIFATGGRQTASAPLPPALERRYG
jgi:hypothetical protein